MFLSFTFPWKGFLFTNLKKKFKKCFECYCDLENGSLLFFHSFPSFLPSLPSFLPVNHLLNYNINSSFHYIIVCDSIQLHKHLLSISCKRHLPLLRWSQNFEGQRWKNPQSSIIDSQITLPICEAEVCMSPCEHTLSFFHGFHMI